MKQTLAVFRGVLAAYLVLGLAACSGSEAASADTAQSPRVLIVGGGSSHDYPEWFQRADSAILAGAGATVSYTDDPAQVVAGLADADVLYQTANQALDEPGLREAVFQHVADGKGLIIGHAGAWYNWQDWPEYNRQLVSGGTHSHAAYGEFTVEVTNPSHPVMAGVPTFFSLDDELYRFQLDAEGPGIEVLATALEAGSGETYPIVWTVNSAGGRIVVNTLGHDGAAHEHPAYQQILQNALQWVTDGS